MDVVEALEILGGTARPGELLALVSRRMLKAAEARGAVERVGRVYRLPESPMAAALARQLRGVRSHRTAAAHWGMSVPAEEKSLTHVTVPHKARRNGFPDEVALHYRDVGVEETESGVTSPVRTVLDCLRDEPLTVALCVGDSALREGIVTFEELAAVVGSLRGRGSRVARTRLAMLDARAANAFESCTRAILLAGGIVGFEPQVNIRSGGKFVGRVDLAHRGFRIVIECDGFETHGGREAFVHDLVRHTELVAAGWRTLRFTWEQVMFRPEWVLKQVREAISYAA